MAKNSIQNNERTISSAFSKLQNRKHNNIFIALQNLCKAGIEAALYLHEPNDKHLHTSNSYASAIYYNGKLLLDKTYVDNGTYSSDVENTIRRYQPVSSGYEAVIFANMIVSDLKNFRLNIPKERDILTITAQDIRNNFSTYFKPV